MLQGVAYSSKLQQMSNHPIHSELKQTQDVVKESVSVSIIPSYDE